MKRIIVFVLLMLAASSVFGQFQRVQQIKAGTGVTISPTSGYGVVTITLGGGGSLTSGTIPYWNGTALVNSPLTVSGNNIAFPASAYFNWGATFGTTGYGLQDAAGTIQFKNSGGSWAAIQPLLTNPVTGTGTSGQVAFWSGTSAVSGDTGFTKSGTGATFDLTLGHALIAPIWHPAADSTTALQINKADGTTNVLSVDTTNGRVGIGTTSPTYLLSLGGQSAQTFWMERETTAATAGNALTVQAGGAVSGGTDLAGGALNLASGISTGAGASVINFQTATAGATGTTDHAPTTKMMIDGAGNVGIGTTGPGYKLEVNGTGLFSNELIGTKDIAIQPSGSTYPIYYKLSGNVYDWFVGSNGSNLNLGTSASDGKLVILGSNGNVGIGLTSPTAVLDLKAGTATASTAPLKFTAGTNLTSPEAGATEWDGTNLFITQTTGPTRKTIAYTDSNITGTAANLSGTPTLPAGTKLTTVLTSTACASSASPAVCSAAPAGFVVIAAGATTVVVNTTAVTANSQIFVVEDESLGTALTVTCNTQALTTLGAPKVTARVAATSFTIGIDVAPTTNPMCISYHLIN